METRTDKFVVAMEKDAGATDVYGPYDKAEAMRVAREMIATIIKLAEGDKPKLFEYEDDGLSIWNIDGWYIGGWNTTVTECRKWWGK